jgi:hypothetical protein
MHNAQAIIQQLQDYCDRNQATLFFCPGEAIKGGPESGLMKFTPAALADFVGLVAANDNQPAKGLTLHAPGYESLAQVLARAFDQASNGKGHERHGNALPFHKQPMQSICGQVGAGFVLGQAIKKVQESQGLPAGRDTAELLGAINYIAGAVIFVESQRHAANDGADCIGI